MRWASILSALYLWGEVFACDASIMGRKLPVNTFLGRIAPLFPLLGFLCARRKSWYPLVQALQVTGCKV